MLKKERKQNKGFAMVTTLLFITVFVILGIAYLVYAQMNVKQSVAVYVMDKHYYAAESAVQVAAQVFNEELENKVNELAGEDFSYTDTSLGVDPDVIDVEEVAENILSEINTRISNSFLAAYQALGDIHGSEFNNGNTVYLIPDPNTVTSITDLPEFELPSTATCTLNDGEYDLRIIGSPTLKISAQSGGRIVSMDVGIEMNFMSEAVPGSSTPTLPETPEGLMGRAYFENNSDEGTIYDNEPPHLLSIDTFNLLGYYSTEDWNELTDEEKALIESPIIVNSYQEAEYRLFILALASILDTEPSIENESFIKSFLNDSTEDSEYADLYTNRSTSLSGSTTGLAVLNGSTINSGYYDVEYLVVNGNLKISGNVNMPNLKGVLIHGNLELIDDGTHFVGLDNGETIFHVAGSSGTNGTALFGSTTSNATVVSYNSRFYVPTSVTLRGKASRAHLEGNSVYIAYGSPGSITFDYGNNTDIEVGSLGAGTAPQFFARGNISGTSIKNSIMRGVFASLTGTIDLNSSQSQGYNGLVIGNVAHDAVWLPRVNSEENPIQANGVADNDVTHIINEIIEEIIENTEPEYVVTNTEVTVELLADSDNMGINNISSLREITGES